MIINPISKGGKGLLPEIIVTAPSGSTLDLMQGSVVLQTYTLSSTETQHTFTVKNTGTYIVRGTSGSDTASVEVVVDTIGLYSCTIEYFNGLRLYWLGDECEDVTGGYVSTQHTTPQGSGGTFNKNTTSIYVKGTSAYSCGEYGCRTSNKIDFSPYKTLRINILSSVQSGYYSSCAKIVISSVETYDEPTIIKMLTVEGSPTGELELDISGISNTPYYLLVVGLAVNGSITIDKIWLE